MADEEWVDITPSGNAGVSGESDWVDLSPPQAEPLSSALDSSDWVGPAAIDRPEEYSLMNELMGVGNAARRGFIATTNLIDKANTYLNPFAITPHGPLGLRYNEDVPTLEENANNTLLRLGVDGSTRPTTELGQWGSDVAENAAASWPFGPAAMVVGGLLGGSGSYAGRKIAPEVGADPEAGAVVGNLLASLGPAGVKTLVKEAGELVGPTVSQFPMLRNFFGDGPARAAVGRTLERASSKSASDLRTAVENAAAASATQTELQALRPLAEKIDDPGIARLADSAEQMRNTGLRSMAEERAALRSKQVTGDRVSGTHIRDISKEGENILRTAGKAIADDAESAWAALDRKSLVDTRLGGLDDQFDAAIKEITWDGTVPLENSAAGLVSRFKALQAGTDEGIANMGGLQDLRGRALEVARRLRNATSEPEVQSRSVALLVERHVRDIVQSNVDAGLLPITEQKKWLIARSKTAQELQTLKRQKDGTGGTLATEKVALQGGTVDNATLINEGLSSPDKLQKQIRAADLGGQDIRPVYKEALVKELDARPQSQWADFFEEKLPQFKEIFTEAELDKFRLVLDDIAAEARAAKLAFTGNSQTARRGYEAQRMINSNRGLFGNFALNSTGGPGVAGAGVGAYTAFKMAPDPITGALLAVPGAIAGSIAGRTLGNSSFRAASAFDDLLARALKDPREALSALDAAKPSDIGRVVSEAISKTAAAQGAREGIKAVMPTAQGAAAASDSVGQPSEKGDQGDPPGGSNTGAKREQPAPPKQREFEQRQSSQLGRQADQGSPFLDLTSFFDPTSNDLGSVAKDLFSEENMGRPVKEVEADIDRDPYLSALYETESGRNPTAKNPKSSASGGFQFVKATAKSLGLDDPMDLDASLVAVKKLTDEHRAKFGDDPFLLYAAHYLGSGLLSKVLNGSALSRKEQELVRGLKEQAMPRFKRIYHKNAGGIENV